MPCVRSHLRLGRETTSLRAHAVIDGSPSLGGPTLARGVSTSIRFTRPAYSAPSQNGRWVDRARCTRTAMTRVRSAQSRPCDDAARSRGLPVRDDPRRDLTPPPPRHALRYIPVCPAWQPTAIRLWIALHVRVREHVQVQVRRIMTAREAKEAKGQANSLSCSPRRAGQTLKDSSERILPPMACTSCGWGQWPQMRPRGKGSSPAREVAHLSSTSHLNNGAVTEEREPGVNRPDLPSCPASRPSRGHRQQTWGVRLPPGAVCSRAIPDGAVLVVAGPAAGHARGRTVA